MRFVDEARITLRSGKGGKGCVSFNHEKYREFGGPDGGNGGRGGHVYVQGSSALNTLYDLRSRPTRRAGNGVGGMGKQKNGKGGEDLVITLPLGTVVRDADKGVVLQEVLDESRYLLLPGGRGGKGNMHFRNAANKTPRYAQPGEAGQEVIIALELQLIADVGLVGAPNAGKSTYISRISSAKPKIADYPFTTLVPNLGVVDEGMGKSLVVADIPGIIPGAHTGVGLGIRFLKHIRRTAVLALLIPCDLYNSAAKGGSLQQTILEAYQELVNELSNFSDDLLHKRQLVLLTKVDVLPDAAALLSPIIQAFAAKGIEALGISAVSGTGVEESKRLLRSTIDLGMTHSTKANATAEQTQPHASPTYAFSDDFGAIAYKE